MDSMGLRLLEFLVVFIQFRFIPMGFLIGIFVVDVKGNIKVLEIPFYHFYDHVSWYIDEEQKFESKTPPKRMILFMLKALS